MHKGYFIPKAYLNDTCSFLKIYYLVEFVLSQQVDGLLFWSFNPMTQIEKASCTIDYNISFSSLIIITIIKSLHEVLRVVRMRPRARG